jgi:hypothetical protein
MKKFLGLAGALVATSVASASISIQASNTAFTDISVTGTAIAGPSDDSEHTLTGATLTGAGFAGNELLAGGMSIRIGNNGSVLWGNSGTDTFTNGDQVGYVNRTDYLTMVGGNLGDTGNGGLAPRQFVSSLWDDNTPGTGGGIRWQVIGGNLYIQWTNEDHFNATGTGTITHQMVVYGGVTIASGNPLVEFVYNDTMYGTNAYQNDGGSATIGYKNWGINANANDVEYGLGGGTNSLADPAFGGTNMQPKVGGWASAANPNLPHSVVIIPEPASAALLVLGALALVRRR